MSAPAEKTARNRAAAEAMYGAARAGDPATFFSYIDPEIVVEEPPFLPYGGRYDGIEGLQQLFGVLATTFDLTSLDFERITADGDYVCAIGRVGLADASGTVAFIERCQMRDGKATHLRIYIHDPSTLLTPAAG